MPGPPRRAVQAAATPYTYRWGGREKLLCRQCKSHILLPTFVDLPNTFAVNPTPSLTHMQILQLADGT